MPTCEPMTLETAPVPILARIFAPIENSGSFYKTQPYPQKISTITMLTALLEDLGVTPYRLSKLIGVTSVTIYCWMNGSQNPSPYNLTLMLQLRSLVHRGKIDLRIVKSIDWSSGEITYKGGLNDKSRNAVSANKRALPDGRSPKRAAISGFFTQSP
jgi:hypothetical protein